MHRRRIRETRATSLQRFSCKRPRKSKQDFLDHLTLLHAQSNTPSEVSEDATDEEKEADRIRRLQAPTTRRRFIFCIWPCDPKGKPLLPEDSKTGKMAANGIQHWGATLFDFYHVRRRADFWWVADDVDWEQARSVDESECRGLCEGGVGACR